MDKYMFGIMLMFVVPICFVLGIFVFGIPQDSALIGSIIFTMGAVFVNIVDNYMESNKKFKINEN